MQSGQADMTDDLGNYRLYNLAPGECYVQATASGTEPTDLSGRTNYVGAFYPGTLSLSQANRVPLRPGDDVQSINFDLRPVRIATIRGIAFSSTGTRITSGAVSITASDSQSAFLSRSSAVSSAGDFRFANVVPGSYRLNLSYAPTSGRAATSAIRLPSEDVSMPLIVEDQDVNVRLTTAPTATISGTVVVDGTGATADRSLGRLTIRAISITDSGSSSVAAAKVRDDLGFEIRGVSGTRLMRVSGLTQGWWLKSVMSGDEDVTDSGLTLKAGEHIPELRITISNVGPEYRGVVITPTNQPADAAVIIFSRDRSQWGSQSRFVRVGRTDETGSFLIMGLPPGEYYAAAVNYLEPGEESDRDLLALWAATAASISIRDSANSTLFHLTLTTR
jgi:hypothetical protein